MSLLFLAIFLLILYIFLGYILFPYLEMRIQVRHNIDDLKPNTLQKVVKNRDLSSTLNEKIGKFVNKSNKKSTDKKMSELASQLYSAGLTIDPNVYAFIRLVFTVLSIVLCTFLAFTIADDPTMQMMYLMLGFMTPYIIFRYSLSVKITQRRHAMEVDLPNILDLLSISVDAGMGFDQGLEYVTEKMNGPLVDELRIVVQRMSYGVTRKEAFKELSEKLDIDTVTNFCSAVVQATEMGIPLREMLKTQADAVRQERVASIKQKASKATVKMLIPMVLFIFPCLFIILLGPAVMNVMSSGVF